MLARIIKNDLNNEIVFSVIVGLLMVGNLFTDMINYITPIPNMYAIIITMLGLYTMLSYGIKFNWKIIIFNLIILIQFLYSFIFINTDMTKYYFMAFITIGFSSLVVSSIKYKLIYVIRTIQIISLFCIPYYMHIYTRTFTVYDSGLLMGLSYSILPVVLSCIIYIFVFYAGEKLYWKLICTINIFFCVLVSSKMSSRGYILCILCFIFLFTLKKINKKNFLKYSIIILFIFLLLIIFFKNPIINSDWYKNVFAIKENNFLNGREIDINAVLNIDNLFDLTFGKGIGSYRLYTGYKYIHNLIGMFIYEHGMLLALLILYLLIFSIKSMLYSNDKNYYLLLMMLFSSSICRLMVSYYFWIDQLFWLFFGLLIFYNNKRYIRFRIRKVR